MVWTAKVNGEPSGITGLTKGELLRHLKSAGIISNYWYDKKRRPIAAWVSKNIVDIDGVDDEDNRIP